MLVGIWPRSPTQAPSPHSQVLQTHVLALECTATCHTPSPQCGFPQSTSSSPCSDCPQRQVVDGHPLQLV